MMHYEEEKYNYKIKIREVQQAKDKISPDNEKWIDVTESEIKIGDIIYVYYMPDSQKYMYTHCPEIGKVINIEKEYYYCPVNDSNTKEEYSITILDYKNQEVNINKDHLSIYSRGYWVNIQKYIG